MTARTCNLDIDALHATWKAATPGEWVQGPFPQVDSTDDEIYVFPSGKWVGSTEHPSDATAIVALHNAFPAIYERLREEVGGGDRNDGGLDPAAQIRSLTDSLVAANERLRELEADVKYLLDVQRDQLARADALIARAERAEAERDAAIVARDKWAEQSCQTARQLGQTEDDLAAETARAVRVAALRQTAEDDLAAAETWIESAVCGTCGEPVVRTEETP